MDLLHWFGVVYSWAYYVVLVLIPWLIYFGVFQKYGNNDFFYFIKLRPAKKAVAKIQRNRSNLGDHQDLQINIPSKKHTSRQYIYGVDQKGNSLALRFTLQLQQIAEVSLVLTLGQKKYLLPGEDGVHFYSISRAQWKARGLSIEVLEPFRRLRISFNGLLKEISSGLGIIEHVQFNFMWNVGSAPIYFPHDAGTKILAEAVAREHWRDGNWMENLLKLELSGYEQFGSLYGLVKTEASTEEITLLLPSYRTKMEGLKLNLAVEKQMRMFLAAEDGTLLNLTLQSCKEGCSELVYGLVIFSDGNIANIDKTDLHLDLGKNCSFPSMFTFHVTAKRRVIRSVVHLNLKRRVQLTSNEENGYEVHQIPCEVDFNTCQAKGIIEFFYYKLGDGKKLPSPILTDKTVPRLPEVLVTNIKEENAQILDLTGGKGNSLALMSTLDPKTYQFIIPEAFVITVNAFNEQLQNNLELKKTAAILDDICCGREQGNIEEACQKTVQLFQKEPIAEGIKKEILRELRKINDGASRWAVRSSAIGEDSEELSAAGQNETYLGLISEEDILDGVRKCWASLFTFQSVQYRWQHGLEVRSQMAVVVQKMVAADSAGVLFTCHPTNPREMMITSNFGLGESVVSAKSDPDTFVISKFSRRIIEKTAGKKEVIVEMGEKGVREVQLSEEKEKSWSISDEQVFELRKVGLQLEEAFGSPRDIEWAFQDNKLYLLQSRPITTLNLWSDDELLHEFDSSILTEENVYTKANVGEVCPGALTVLSQTTSRVITDKAIQLAINNKYDKYVNKSTQMFQHHMMLNVVDSIHRGAKKEISIPSKIMDLAIFGHPVINPKINGTAYSRYGHNKLAPLKEVLKMLGFAWNCKKEVQEMTQKVAKFNIEFSKKDSLEEMYQQLDQAVDHLGTVFYAHGVSTSASIFYQIIAMTCLLEKNKDFTIDHYQDIALILSSCEDVVSAEVPAFLEEIALLIQKQGLVEEFKTIDPKQGLDFLQRKSSEVHTLLKKFLKDHGHRLLREFEIKAESWASNPTEVIKMLQVSCSNTNTKRDKVNISIEEVVEKLTTPKSKITKMILRFILSKMRAAVGYREKSKCELVRGLNKFRLAYKVFGQEMVLQGLIPNKDLLFHLSHFEVGQLIKKRNPQLLSKALRRQRLYQKWDKLKFPEIMYGFPKSDQKQDFNFGNSDVFCTGTPVCSGEIKARACVILNLEDIGQLKPGDILITYSTDIGWSPYFPMLSAVVTELGGLVSHGAVVAREYGLPCIVGAQNATKIFKTGDIVLVSGKKGRLELCQRD